MNNDLTLQLSTDIPPPAYDATGESTPNHLPPPYSLVEVPPPAYRPTQEAAEGERIFGLL